MNVQNTTVLHTALLPLATLSVGVTKTARRGKRIRLYRPELTLAGPALDGAVRALAETGATVRVYEASRIWTAEVVEGVVIWSSRDTNKYRAAVVVEVTL